MAKAANPGVDPETLPVIRREGIHWVHSADGHSLLLTLTLENPHAVATPPVPLTIGLAGFGAFVPDVPIATLLAPGMEPGDRRRVMKQIPHHLEGRRELAAEFVERIGPQVIERFWRARGAALVGDDPGSGALLNLAERIRSWESQYTQDGGKQAPLASEGQARSRNDLERPVHWGLKHSIASRAPYSSGTGANLMPQGARNVVVRSPGGRIIAHRHMAHYGALRAGKAYPLPFWVLDSSAPAERRGSYEMSVRELSEGWSAGLEPGVLGKQVPPGSYFAFVTPPRDATEGHLIVDVADVNSGEVCPVEWYWGERSDLR